MRSLSCGLPPGQPARNGQSGADTIARADRTRRRLRVWLARRGRTVAKAWDRPGLRTAAAVTLALLVNAALLGIFGHLPMRLPPEGGGGAPIEIVFLPVPPAPEPEPEPELTPEVAEAEAEATPEPAPKPRRGPAAPDAELPSVRGASGVVALDCKAVFDEEGRAVACAGGDITLGYEVDREAWDAIAAEVPRYGPRPPEALATFGEADDRFAAEPRRLERFRRQGAASLAAAERREAPPASIISGSGAENAAWTGADILAPQSFVTSHGDQRIAAEKEEARRDASFRRERIEDLEAEE